MEHAWLCSDSTSHAWAHIQVRAKFSTSRAKLLVIEVLTQLVFLHVYGLSILTEAVPSGCKWLDNILKVCSSLLLRRSQPWMPLERRCLRKYAGRVRGRSEVSSVRLNWRCASITSKRDMVSGMKFYGALLAGLNLALTDAAYPSQGQRKSVESMLRAGASRTPRST